MRTKGLATSTEAALAQPGRGRDATSPFGIPLRGWVDITKRLFSKVAEDNVLLIAAGVAFYGVLAVFPTITAMMAFIGLLYSPGELVAALQGASQLVPPDVSRIIFAQAEAVAGVSDGGLTLSLALSLLLALWSSSNGVGSLIQGVNIAYDQRERRSYLQFKIRALIMTLFMIFNMIIAITLVIVVPVILAFAAITPDMARLIQLIAYVPLGIIFIAGVTALYRWGPDRARAKWRWLTPGAMLASVMWLAASVGFSYYVQTFGSYNETFGSIAGVIVLLMWLWLSALVILIGAEVNAEIEAQTARDSTIGPREPMGHRNAVKADELGRVG